MNECAICDTKVDIKYLPKILNWSPDGNSLISSSFSNTLQIYNRMQILHTDKEHQTEISFVDKVDLKFPTTITSCCWYPLMNIDDSSSCCFACVMPFNPIQLVDSNTGRIRSIYRCQYNNYPASLTSIIFNGGSLLTGGTRTLYECPIQRCDYLGKPVIECPGSIMSIAPHPISAYIVLGISTGDIVFIDSRNYQVILSEKYHNHAVDQISFTTNFSSPQDLVFTSARLENEVIGIDIRMPNVPFTAIETKRNSSRAISLSCGNFGNNKCLLFVGNEDDEAKIFDINADSQLFGTIGNGPTPLAVYNYKKNVIAVASGKHEIIDDEYDYSDNENEDQNTNSNLMFEPRLKSFKFYTKKE